MLTKTKILNLKDKVDELDSLLSLLEEGSALEEVKFEVMREEILKKTVSFIDFIKDCEESLKR